jgi:hypothetical protein
MRLPLVLVAIVLAAPALAQETPPPAQQALAQMVGEAQQREASALMQVYSLRAQLVAERQRADDAEARLKSLAPQPAK